MEREKQKAVERERQEILRKQELEARKKIEDQARAVLNPSKSKFVSIIQLFLSSSISV
jgi:arginine/serine-rich splicing factor 18